MIKSPFTASNLQVATYLLGVALFSISFLVFLNSSISFVVTDLIGQKNKVGDAVGTLGFADEIVALVACPFWGLMSDKLGVRNVVVMGYAIVGISLWVLVQARNVYPQLLLARLFFSIGGAATSTMVTAILPTMTSRKRSTASTSSDGTDPTVGQIFPPVTDANAPMIPSQDFVPIASQNIDPPNASRSATSQIAGLVGMFTGLGALLALGVFLPLPARLQKQGYTPANAVTDSFYLVGSVAIAVALACALGLARLGGEENKGFKALIQSFKVVKAESSGIKKKPLAFSSLLIESLKLGFTDTEITIGYVGGFVARASSVAISLFIPLYVNAYFISSGLCESDPNSDPHSTPHDIKEQCRRAYSVAAALSGVSQLVALIFAPIFGYLDGRFRNGNIPLLVAALSGIIGYVIFAKLPSPDPKSDDGSPVIFLVMALLGISQIGAIVCSLSSLGRGIQGGPQAANSRGSNGAADDENQNSTHNDTSPLLPSHLQNSAATAQSRSHLKGSIAGLYSLAGGAGILLLTKLGGTLFDTMSTGAPFYMLAIFNAILFIVVLACSFASQLGRASMASVGDIRT